VLDRPTIAESKVEWWNEEFPQYKLSSAGRVNLDESATETEYSTDADQLYGIMQIYRHKMIDDDAWPVRVRAFYKEWKSWKARCALLDFTDLIEVAYRDVSNAPGFPVMGFFDEVQDFTRVEIELCRKWGREMQYIMMAGDDDQGIYDFKGATCDAFLDPPIDDDHKRILQQSFRVPRAVQALAEKWISKVRRREEKAYKPRDDARPKEDNNHGDGPDGARLYDYNARCRSER
jgi:superfamily I DNA/RNA helicase